MNLTKLFQIIILSNLLFSFSYVSAQNGNESFQIGVIADCQYCSDPGEGIRKYALSPYKLQQCVDHFNTLSLEYVIHLGDFIDRDFESFKVVTTIFNQLKAPKYHVLGNHDFFVADDKKDSVPSVLGLASKYYDFNVKDWRFVVLDGNDISFQAYPENSQGYNQSLSYYEDLGSNPPKWNGALGAKQLQWLKGVLEQATSQDEKVILYCHFPIAPADIIHNLWNSDEIIALLVDYSCVKAFINGHNHAGNYVIKEGIHLFTLKGMVDTEETSYAVIRISNEDLVVEGFGREEDRVMEIKN